MAGPWSTALCNRKRVSRPDPRCHHRVLALRQGEHGESRGRGRKWVTRCVRFTTVLCYVFCREILVNRSRTLSPAKVMARCLPMTDR